MDTCTIFLLVILLLIILILLTPINFYWKNTIWNNHTKSNHVSYHKKCVSLNNQQFIIKPSLIHLHSNKYSQELCYYIFAVNLDRWVGSFNIRNGLSNRLCVLNKMGNLYYYRNKWIAKSFKNFINFTPLFINYQGVLIAVSIYCCLIKYPAKQKYLLPYSVTNNKLEKFLF